MSDYSPDEGDEAGCSLWNCVLLKGNCSLFNTEDPRVFYFVVVAFAFYLLFLFMILADLKYWWSLDKAQQQIYYYVDSVKCKLRNVQTQQRHMNEARTQSEKYIARSGSMARMLQAARGGDWGIELDPASDPHYSVATVTDTTRSRQLWTSCDEDANI